MKIILANPRGFCAGVERAIDIVEKALIKYGKPVYVRHEIVHNKFVVEDLKKKGAIFVKEIDEIPKGAVTIFSAHGVSRKVEDGAKLMELDVIDATCPLVTKVHNQAIRNEREGRKIILIGHKNHPEVVGTSGRVEQQVTLVETEDDVAKIDFADDEKLAYITQTTLSVDETKGVIQKLKERFTDIIGPETEDICYATQNRQNAVRYLAKICNIVYVVGSKNSSNSNRLQNLAQECGAVSYLIDNYADINIAELTGVSVVGITAGASAPEVLVRNIISFLQDNFKNVTIENLEGITEDIHFRLPKKLRRFENNSI